MPKLNLTRKNNIHTASILVSIVSMVAVLFLRHADMLTALLFLFPETISICGCGLEIRIELEKDTQMYWTCSAKECGRRKEVDIIYVYTYACGELLPLPVVINRLFEPRGYTWISLSVSSVNQSLKFVHKCYPYLHVTPSSFIFERSPRSWLMAARDWLS